MTGQIRHYTVLEPIGEGHLGPLYRARDTKLGRTVALRLTGALDSGSRDALLEAARRVARLSHPNLAALFDAGLEDGRVFLVFEYVPGQSLRALIGQGRIPPRTAVGLSIQIAEALAEGWRHAMMHGGINPDTVLVTPRGRAKVLDLGFLAWTREGVRRRQGGAPGPPGVLSYIAPEQSRGDSSDTRADVFALGVMLYEMLTGRSPFLHATAEDTAAAVVETSPPAPSAVEPALPARLDVVLGRALAKPPYGRYGSVEAFAMALRDLAARLEPGEATREGPVVTVTPAGRARAIWWALAALVLVALLAWIRSAWA